MKFAIAAAALVAGVSASSYPAYSAAPNVTYTTAVVTSYETYCPGPTQITYGTNTYTVTEATTLTITDCPCTVSVPVYTTSSVICSTCSSSSPSSPAYPTLSVPSYPSSNSTAVYPTSTPEVPTTGGVYPTTTPSSTPIPTAGAGKVAALSGGAFAGLIGLVAFAL
ncbi:putative CLOCK-CONTROLLED PROTEIN 6 [Rosellinia necatrix]|uniref:Putative CLOCK-CONTROLLED PROTEIN 6 n=1 Tax=Rosellinia necatrix TaxID=77044 RepID=A0A1S7UIV2_ROSNE|nr:putative CLOCK-CONTROLLED PROTEIN 6 [Rosellinia necatrix]